MATGSAVKLAFVHPSFEEHGGAENYLIAAMNGLASRGHDVHLFTAGYDSDHFPPPETAPYTLHTLGGRGYMEGIGGTFKMAQWLRADFTGYDRVIPVNFPAHIWTALARPNTPLIWLCMEPKRALYPRVMFAEAPDFQQVDYRKSADYRSIWELLRHDAHVLLPYRLRAALQRLLDRYAVRQINTILTHSDYTAGKIRRIYPRQTVQAIGAGLPEPQFKGLAEEKIILVPTRLEPVKNVEVALRAMHRLKESNRSDGYRLVVMGTGSDAERLQSLTAQLDLEDCAGFTGFVSDAERDALYERCALAVYPALAEPFGMPVIEAGRYGKPVIASHQGGPATMIQHNKNGLLVDMIDIPALTDAIGRLIHDAGERQRLGQLAQHMVTTHYNLEQWLDRLEVHLNSARK